MEGKPQALTSKYFTTLRSLHIAGDLQCALLLLWLTRYIYKGGNLETDYDMIHTMRAPSPAPPPPDVSLGYIS
jgi:hypothetical protein